MKNELDVKLKRSPSDKHDYGDLDTGKCSRIRDMTAQSRDLVFSHKFLEKI